jgi:16S rRNA (guanine527-N7)-methyltransferase
MSSVIGDIVAQEARTFGLSLTPHEIDAFEIYAAELLKWNSKVNLTAITKDKEIAVKHFVDSLSIAAHLSDGDRLLDIGSGAGLPIIPLQIVRPNVAMVSVDAVAKKINFQRHVIRSLELKNIEALHARVESLHKTHPHYFSVITSRAFTRLDRFVSLAAPLLAENGTLIAMKGEGADDEIAESSDVLSAGGFTIISIQSYTLPYNMGKRVLTFLKPGKAA